MAVAADAAGRADGVIHLIRHAIALERRTWTQPDELRPLDARGFAQARSLAARYESRRPDRLLSSPFVRCIQTLQPTAEACGMAVEVAAFLEEGAPAEEAETGLLAKLSELHRAGQPDGSEPRPLGSHPLLLACTHGDVLEGFVERLLEEGVDFEGSPRTPKSVTYELEVIAGRFARARVVAPPEPRG